MRILLVSTNRSEITVPPFPLGLACVAANMDPQRHEVEVWDARLHDDWETALRDCLRQFQPEVIGLSVRNVDDQEMRKPFFFLDEVREMVDVCREESSAVLVAGGSGFSLFPAEILDFLGLDYGLVGEGERTFPQLLDRVEAGQHPTEVPGAVWREGGLIHRNPPLWLPHVDDLAIPERDRLNAAWYFEARGTAGIPNSATIQSKRGCSLSCSYCSTFAIEGTTVRMRSPQAVVDEMQDLQNRGLSRLLFVDSLFTNPPEHAQAICEELGRRGLNISWSALINPAFADPDLLQLMKQTGCSLVVVGNESGCSRILESLRKGFQREDVERCFAACEQLGLRYNAFLLLGGPGEDRASVKESLEVLARFHPQQVTVTVGLRLYPGCALTHQALEEGLLAPTADLLTPRFYLAPAVRDWIWDYLEPIVARQPGWAL